MITAEAVFVTLEGWRFNVGFFLCFRFPLDLLVFFGFGDSADKVRAMAAGAALVQADGDSRRRQKVEDRFHSLLQRMLRDERFKLFLDLLIGQANFGIEGFSEHV